MSSSTVVVLVSWLAKVSSLETAMEGVVAVGFVSPIGTVIGGVCSVVVGEEAVLNKVAPLLLFPVSSPDVTEWKRTQVAVDGSPQKGRRDTDGCGTSVDVSDVTEAGGERCLSVSVATNLVPGAGSRRVGDGVHVASSIATEAPECA